MRWMIVSLNMVALLAACSSDAPQETARDGKTQTPPRAAASETGAAPSAPGLHAKVSPLSGKLSGLNTRVTDMGTIIDLPSDALFEYDEAALTPAAEVELRKAAELIRASPPGAIEIIGHTDSKGDDSYNRTLSEARARTVADWFGRQVGVRQREFRVSGKGESAPIAPNEDASGADDPAGRAKNRRVEVVVPTAAS